MSDEPRDLLALQRWMQAVITHPLGIEAGIESDEARELIDIESDEVEEVVTRSEARTSIERLEVYGNAYFSRLLECLRDQFPALVQALSEEVFDQFALDYLYACPPHSYTLNQLSDRFAAFLTETRPARDEEEENSEPDWADFVIDLARLEEAIDDVFDGPGLERETPLSAEILQAISPERWPECRLIPSPALRLLAFQFPINDYFTAYRAGEEPAIPLPEATYLALHRREYIVRRFALSAPQFALLSAIVAGNNVSAAIAAAAKLAEDWDQFASDLRNWFFDWCAAGFFRSVEVS
jgi:hypothetical protein